MMMKSDEMKPFADTNTLADNSDFLVSGKGNFVFKGNLSITGVFSGMLRLSGSLHVGVNARITGELDVEDLTVYGHMVGTVKVRNRVVFHDGSTFSGTISAAEGDFHDGSLLSGNRNIGRIITDRRFEPADEFKNTISNSNSPVDPIPDKINYPIFKI